MKNDKRELTIKISKKKIRNKNLIIQFLKLNGQQIIKFGGSLYSMNIFLVIIIKISIITVKIWKPSIKKNLRII